MSGIKQQKIIAFLSFSPSDKNVMLHGIKIAGIFGKELCLVYNLHKNEKKHNEKYKNQIREYISTIKNKIPSLKISNLLTSGKLAELPEKLADDFEAIILVAAAAEFAKYSKSVTESSIPFLFVNGDCENVPEFKKLVLPIDLRKENSESTLWSSYFGRFNKSVIVVVAANDKGKENIQQVTKNVVLTKKLFLKFDIEHKIFRGTKSSFRNTFEALELAHSSKSDLLIILGSSTITPLDLLIGLPERKIIKRAEDLPVLIINPRKDNYILCD